jgi:hypothetical protein
VVLTGDGFVAKREIKARKGTFADLRGILSDRVKPPSDRELRQWIDEARSRALANVPETRTRSLRHVDDE